MKDKQVNKGKILLAGSTLSHRGLLLLLLCPDGRVLEEDEDGAVEEADEADADHHRLESHALDEAAAQGGA